MSETSDRRRHRSGTRRRLSRYARLLIAIGGVVAIVLVASGVAIVLAGGIADPQGSLGPSTGAPAPTHGASAASLGPPPPAQSGGPPSGSAYFSPPPVPTATASPEPTPSVAPSLGIRAKRIRLERLGIDLPIVAGDGVDAPIGKAAHYPGSAWPGDGSNIYLYGHARKGMFIALWQAKAGDEVVLLLVDGTERTYVVTKVLPRVPWDAIEYLDPTPTEQLTLQTSTSYYPTAPRFIVIAVPET